jgi:threonine/homoserine/homoserine lactone efflux protein
MVFAGFQGLMLGLWLAIMVGPSFFALINISLTKGFYSAFYMAVGISMSDILLIIIALFGLNSVLKTSEFTNQVGIVGGLLLFFLGIKSIFFTKKNQISHNFHVKGEQDILKNIFKGFIVNSFNPSVILFWIAAVGGIISKTEFTFSQTLFLFVCTIITTFFTDILKIKLSNKLSQYMTSNFLGNLSKVMGVILSFSGLLLIYQALK